MKAVLALSKEPFQASLAPKSLPEATRAIGFHQVLNLSLDQESVGASGQGKGAIHCEPSFRVDERVRDQTEQVTQIIARKPNIVSECIDPVHDDDLEVGEYA